MDSNTSGKYVTIAGTNGARVSKKGSLEAIQAEQSSGESSVVNSPDIETGTKNGAPYFEQLSRSSEGDKSPKSSRSEENTAESSTSITIVRELIVRATVVVQNSNAILIVALILFVMCYVPLFGSNRNTVYEDKERRDYVETINGYYPHDAALLSLGMIIPITVDNVMDLRLTRGGSLLVAEWCLFLGLIVPCVIMLVHFRTPDYNLGPTMFSAAMYSQEILVTGAVLAMHSLSSQSQLVKLCSFVTALFFCLGQALLSYIGADSIPNTYIASLFCWSLGMLGILLLVYESMYTYFKPGSDRKGGYCFCCSTDLDSSHTNSAKEKTLLFDNSRVYIIILFVNVVLRVLAFSVWGTRAQTPEHGIGMHIIVNAIVVLLVSMHRSRSVIMNYAAIGDRLATKRNFVRYISHEIRTPLNTVQMGLQLVLESVNEKICKIKNDEKSEASDEQSSEYSKMEEMLADTFGCCSTAVDILNDILTYDKLEGGDIKMNVSMTSVPVLIDASLQPFNVQARQAGVGLVYQGPDNVHSLLSSQPIEVDEKKIHQVIRNLVSNALKFTPRGGTISVYAYPCKGYDDVKLKPNHAAIFGNNSISNSQVEADGSGMNGRVSISSMSGDFASSLFKRPQASPKFVRIDVCDTGVGMSESKQCQLFTDMVQFHDTLSTNENGAGLGMWISKSIVDLHKGRIAVHSEGVAGLGCQFSVVLKLGASEINTALIANTPADVVGVGGSNSSIKRARGDGTRAKAKNRSRSKTENAKNASISVSMSRALVYPIDSCDMSGPPEEDRPTITQNFRGALSASLETISTSDRTPELLTRNSMSFKYTGTDETSLKRGHVLVVDDSALNRKMMSKYVERYFAQVSTAEDGVDAVQKVVAAKEKGEDVDIVLMDNVMPHKDGLQASTELRRLGFLAPIIGVTGNGLPDQVESFLKSGADQVVVKPVDFPELRRVIVDVMGENAPASLKAREELKGARGK